MIIRRPIDDDATDDNDEEYMFSTIDLMWNPQVAPGEYSNYLNNNVLSKVAKYSGSLSSRDVDDCHARFEVAVIFLSDDIIEFSDADEYHISLPV
jgi:hypothetical protein